MFKKTLAKAVKAGVLKGKLTAIIDSSPVHGAGAVAESYELIRKMASRLARAMGDRLDSELAEEAAGLAGSKPEIDWQDPAARRAHLGDLVEMAVELLAAAVGDPAVGDAADELSQVVLQDVEDRGDGPAIKDGVARDRIVSHSDPEMRHGRKSASRRFDGHKLDAMIDESSEIVLGVDVRGRERF